MIKFENPLDGAYLHEKFFFQRIYQESFGWVKSKLYFTDLSSYNWTFYSGFY